MSEVEIEQIRSVNPFPDELPAPPLEPVLRRLEHDAAAVSRRRRLAWMPSLGGVFVAGSVLVSVSIVVIALGALGHRAHDSAAGRPRAGRYPAVVQRVVAQYAIFRRPQTATDRGLASRWLPAHTLPALVRHVTTKAGHSEFVALSLNRSHLTAWLLDWQGKGGGQSSFTPFPLHNAGPALVEIAGQTLGIVPDSVTRVVWTNYTNAVVTTRPEHNLVYGPPIPEYGATFYAGSRQLDQEAVPVERIRLTAPSGSPATGQAAISNSNGVSSMQIDAHRVHGAHGRYGVWLYTNAERKNFLGFRVAAALAPRDTLFGDASWQRAYDSYHQLLITRQTDHNSATPGKIILQGDIPR